MRLNTLNLLTLIYIYNVEVSEKLLAILDVSAVSHGKLDISFGGPTHQ